MAIWNYIVTYFSGVYHTPLEGLHTLYLLPLYLVYPFLGGLLFRIRGGYLGDAIKEKFPWLGWGLSKQRLLTSLFYTIPLCVVTLSYEPLFMIVGLYLGMVMGWFDAADLGRNKDRARFVEIGLMSLRGLLLTGFAAAIAYGIGVSVAGSVVFGLSGMIFLPLCYDVGWMLDDTDIDFPANFKPGMELGEVLTGVYLSGIMVLMFYI